MMLLRYCFKNHGSFRDESCLSLVPSKLKEDADYVILTKHPSLAALPSCLIYGANASGKSQALDALEYMKYVVLSSHAKWGPDDPIRRAPFKLDLTSQNSPSEFSVDFVLDSTLYQFGFSVDSEAFVEEWVYAYPKGSRQIWYERKRQKIKFGSFLRGGVTLIQGLMRKNSLFLSTAAQNNHEQLTPLYRFFSEIEFSGEVFRPGKVVNIDPKRLKAIVEFLKVADVGIVSAKVEKEDAPEEIKAFLKSLQGVFDKELKKSRSKKSSIQNQDFPRVDQVEDFERILFGHQRPDGEVIYFDLHMESSGTIRLANLLAPILLALEKGSLLVIDELDVNLHPILATKIVEMFNSPDINENGAQLIATTHDTNILCSDLVRRDQIWFSEKDNDGASTLYPLADFSVRRSDNLEKGYLDGRFGAVPFLGSIRKIRELIEN